MGGLDIFEHARFQSMIRRAILWEFELIWSTCAVIFMVFHRLLENDNAGFFSLRMAPEVRTLRTCGAVIRWVVMNL